MRNMPLQSACPLFQYRGSLNGCQAGECCECLHGMLLKAYLDADLSMEARENRWAANAMLRQADPPTAQHHWHAVNECLGSQLPFLERFPALQNQLA